MTQRHLATLLGLGAALLMPAGCTQHYNGALGVASSHRTAAQRTPAAANDAGRVDRAETGADVAAADRGAAAALPAIDLPGGAVTQNPDGPLAAMGLYGQVAAELPGRMSPLDGSGDLTRITFTVDGADFDPALDPTGDRIVYASTRNRRTADLYVKSVTGNVITQLTSDPGNEVMPTFSPDGRKVAFASDRSGNWDIYLIDADGGRPVQLTSDLTHDIHPSFSPDGRRLVYCSYGAASGQWEMVIIDVEQPTTRRVIGLGLFPSWSPTDDRIVFQRARQRGTRWFSIWTVELRGGEVSPPTEIALSANAAVITPAWSPDGERIVFCTVVDPTADEHSRPTQADVWVVGVDGSGRRRLTEGRFANLQPAWSKDGSIYFVSNRGVQNVENIWAMKAGSIPAVAGPTESPDAAAMTPPRHPVPGS